MLVALVCRDASKLLKASIHDLPASTTRRSRPDRLTYTEWDTPDEAWKSTEEPVDLSVAIRVQATASRKRKLTESDVDELLEKMAEMKDDLKELKAIVKQKDAKINKLKASKKKCKSIGVDLFTQCEELKLQLAKYQPVEPVNLTESRPGDNPVDPVVVE